MATCRGLLILITLVVMATLFYGNQADQSIVYEEDYEVVYEDDAGITTTLPPDIVTSAIPTNLALRKTAYVYTTYYPVSNGVDGKLNNFALANGKNKWFIVDLGRDYRVIYVVVYTRKDCCGDRMSNFKVGFLKGVYRNNFQKNELCGAYKGATKTGGRYELKCKQPFQKARYVSLYVDLPQYPDMSFAEFEVYGDDRD